MFPMPGLPVSKTVHADGTVLTQNPDGSFTVPQALISAMFNSGNWLLDNVSAPATSSSAGVPGQWAYDASYVYICTAANTWKRVAIAGGF